MRLWHVDLLPYLPKSQLLSQWRELNSIFKKQDKHILINYVYAYDKEYLLWYTHRLFDEFKRRKFNIKSYENYNNYFMHIFDSCLFDVYLGNLKKNKNHYRYNEHNDMYLRQCFYNLQEKYYRCQKDFCTDTYNKLCEFYIDNQ